MRGQKGLIFFGQNHTNLTIVDLRRHTEDGGGCSSRVVVAHLTRWAEAVHQLGRHGRVAPDQHLLTTKTATALESFSLSLVSQKKCGQK